MAKRKTPDRPAAPIVTAQAAHGPSRPAQARYGVARLRAVLNLTDAVSVDDLCEEAAHRIEQAQQERPRGFRDRPMFWTKD